MQCAYSLYNLKFNNLINLHLCLNIVCNKILNTKDIYSLKRFFNENCFSL